MPQAVHGDQLTLFSTCNLLQIALSTYSPIMESTRLLAGDLMGTPAIKSNSPNAKRKTQS
jgi:hypothetical protein